jgi:hypothetical protein
MMQMMQSTLTIGTGYGRNRSTYLASRDWQGRTCWLSAQGRLMAAFQSLLRMVEYFAPGLNSKTWLTYLVEAVRAVGSIGKTYLLMAEKD